MASQLEAAQSLVDALKAQDRLTQTDEALVAIVLGLAGVLDHPGCPECGCPAQTAALWKELRAAVMDLAARGASDDPDDATKRAKAGVSMPPPMRSTVGNPS